MSPEHMTTEELIAEATLYPGNALAHALALKLESVMSEAPEPSEAAVFLACYADAESLTIDLDDAGVMKTQGGPDKTWIFEDGSRIRIDGADVEVL